MSLKLLKIICRVFWTHHLSTPEVLAVCVPSKRGLLDLSARNIRFLREGPPKSVGLASAVTKSLASDTRILANVVSGRLEVNCWGVEPEQSSSRKKESSTCIFLKI